MSKKIFAFKYFTQQEFNLLCSLSNIKVDRNVEYKQLSFAFDAVSKLMYELTRANGTESLLQKLQKAIEDAGAGEGAITGTQSGPNLSAEGFYRMNTYDLLQQIFKDSAQNQKEKKQKPKVHDVEVDTQASKSHAQDKSKDFADDFESNTGNTNSPRRGR